MCELLSDNATVKCGSESTQSEMQLLTPGVWERLDTWNCLKISL